MNVGSLFSGIGGLDHGLARAGLRHVFLCESDPWRREVLAHHFPGVPIYEDVREIDAASWEARDAAGRRALGGDSDHPSDHPSLVDGSGLDLLCGGFPCQDVSVAGRRAGLAGERSGLFYEFARIAESLRPRFVLVENVPGLLSSNGGRDFGAVVGTLADVGYGVAWRILDSRYFGVPQRRRRVFVLGALADGDPRGAAERCGEILAVGTRCERHSSSRGEAGTDFAATLGASAGGGRGHDGNPDRGGHSSLSGIGNGGPDDNDAQAGRLVIAATLKAQRGKAGDGLNPEETLVAAPLSHGSNPNSNMAGRRREDDENLVTAFSHTQGLDAQPSAEAWPSLRKNGGGMGVGVGVGVRRLTPTECERLQALPDGWTDFGPDSRRYAALGDAVTSSVAEWIGRRLMAA